MAEHELIDTKTARTILGIGSGSLAHLIAEGRLGDTYTWSPTGRQKRVLLDRGRVETLAASDWRKR